MLNIKKMLLPLDLEESSLPLAVIREAFALAHRFHSEVLLLHVVRPTAYMARSEQSRELIAEAVHAEEEKLKQCLGPELSGLSVRRVVLQGDPAREILRAAVDEKIDLIVMPTHGYGDYERFLVGSVTTKVLHNGKCPVWSSAHLDDDSLKRPFAIHNILCPVDFSSHSPKTVRWAQDVANEFNARLTLAHATPGVEIYGPGGSHVLTNMKRELVNGAMDQMARIQRDLGTKAEVFIGCGDAPKIMIQAAYETKADLLVVGCRSADQRFGNTGYAIIRESPVPVLSV